MLRLEQKSYSIKYSRKRKNDSLDNFQTDQKTIPFIITMTDITILLDILFYNIAAPILVSSFAIWIFTDMRKLNIIKKIGKIEVKAKEKA